MADQTTWEKREEFEDGSYNNIRVQKVSNGFIKTITSYKSGEEEGYKEEKSIHTDNPLEEKTLIDKLDEYLKNR